MTAQSPLFVGYQVQRFGKLEFFSKNIPNIEQKCYSPVIPGWVVSDGADIIFLIIYLLKHLQVFCTFVGYLFICLFNLLPSAPTVVVCDCFVNCYEDFK